MTDDGESVPPEPKEGVLVKDGQVVIYLNRVGAEWLHSCLPEWDGFARELWRTIESLPLRTGRGDR